MRRLSLWCMAGVLGLLLVLPSVAGAAGRTHTVQNGETLTSIAAENNVSVDTLVATNGLASPNLIFVGQQLVIPGGAAPAAPAAPAPAGPAPAAGGDTYVVQPGDNLSGIAARYGVSLDTLVQANGLSDSNYIWAGERLRIAPAPAAPAPAPAPAAPAPPASAPPAAPPARATGNRYTVQVGDNLSTIAAQYGVSVDALAQANGVTNPNLLFAGQVLSIPGAGASPAPAKGTGGRDTGSTGHPPAAAPPAAAPPANPTPAPAAPPAPAPPRPTPTAHPAPAGAAPTPTLQVAPTPAPDKAKIVPLPANGTAIKYTIQSGDALFRIAAKYKTTVDAIVARNHLPNANSIFSGQVIDIMIGDMVSKPADNGQPTPPPAPMDKPVTRPGNDRNPPPIDSGNAGKWIDVNLSTETLTAYEGNTPVFSTAVSTGIATHPTVVGTYKIYAKYLADDMTGGVGSEYYYLPAVPYTMYFYGGYAIHGTYWHHNFGHPMSHGCVNLPTPAAKWMFNWAPMGTTVTTHW